MIVSACRVKPSKCHSLCWPTSMPVPEAMPTMLEHHGFVAVDQDPVLQVPAEAARQDDLLDVAALAHEVRDGVVVADPDDVLLDDRAGVQLGGDVVAGGPDELDAAAVGLVVRAGADERRQEAVVDVERPAGPV